MAKPQNQKNSEEEEKGRARQKAQGTED